MTRLLGVILLLVPALTARAATLDVSIGFENAYHVGRWTPVRVTVADKKTRAAALQLFVPHSVTSEMLVNQGVTIGPDAQTFVFYLPIGYAATDFVATLRDADTGQALARFPNQDDPNTLTSAWQAEQLIVCCGNGFRLGPSINFQPDESETQRNATTAVMRPAELPAAAVGLDGVEILILSAVGPNTLSLGQQQAVADWVRTGGKLVYWPGDQVVAADSPIGRLLPATFGPVRTVNLSDDALRNAGLAARFANLNVRPLTPRAGARTITLWQDEGRAADSSFGAVHGDVGLGHVLALPIDASLLQISGGGEEFWHRLILEAFPLDSRQFSDYGYDLGGRREEAGLSAALDAIGQIPGAGTFGFGYIVLTLGAMMFVVGPVDWFVLKKTGHQPWTWFTTAGWIGLVTVGAVYAGGIFRSGDLHFRTLSVIDEIDGQAVSRADALLLFSPQTARYTIETDPSRWWEPFGTTGGYSSSSIKSRVTMTQDRRGNRPTPMDVAVWSYQFLHARGPTRAAAALEANLSLAADGTFTGTIRNTRAVDAGTVYARTAKSVYKLTIPLPAGTTVETAGKWVSVNATEPDLIARPQTVYYGYNYAATAENSVESLSATPFPDTGGLNTRGADALERLLRSDPAVVVLYTSFPDDPPAKLDDPSAKTEHHTLVRAVVRVKARQ